MCKVSQSGTDHRIIQLGSVRKTHWSTTKLSIYESLAIFVTALCWLVMENFANWHIPKQPLLIFASRQRSDKSQWYTQIYSGVGINLLVHMEGILDAQQVRLSSMLRPSLCATRLNQRVVIQKPRPKWLVAAHWLVTMVKSSVRSAASTAHYTTAI